MTPDADFALVLITGRQLEHWHTGSMSRRANVLDALEPAATASLHPSELTRLGIAPGSVFVPFAYVEAAHPRSTQSVRHDPRVPLPRGEGPPGRRASAATRYSLYMLGIQVDRAGT